jgi:hypothetical protein
MIHPGVGYWCLVPAGGLCVNRPALRTESLVRTPVDKRRRIKAGSVPWRVDTPGAMCWITGSTWRPAAMRTTGQSDAIPSYALPSEAPHGYRVPYARTTILRHPNYGLRP